MTNRGQLGNLRAAIAQAGELRRAGRRAEAEALCRSVLAADRRHPGALQLLGMLAFDSQNPVRAAELFAKAAKADPGNAATRTELGRALLAVGRVAEAEQALRAAIRITPDSVFAHCGLGYALWYQQKHVAAEQILHAALRLDPRMAAAHLYLGFALQGQRRHTEAEACYRAALALEPDSELARYNLGSALHAQGRYDEALECYRAVLERNPVHRGASLNRALLRLVRGEFGAAWGDYRGRPSRAGAAAKFPALRLEESLPADLSGRDVLLLHEQGLGDELFFLRFAPLLKSRGARVRYCSSAKLATILGRCAALDDVVASVTQKRGEHVLLVGDLPLALGSGECTPPPLALEPLADRVATLRERLHAAGPPPWIGIAWRAGTPVAQQDGMDHTTLLKEVPLGLFGNALAPWEGTVVALQRFPGPDELAELGQAIGRPVHDFSAHNENLEDMLALLALLDEYAGVSSTNVHLHAGLGRTGHILVPWPPEWRWLADGVTTPWFPGHRIYRQGSDGDWSAALAALRASLRQG